MSNYKRKNKWKSIIGAVLGIALLVGSVAGVAAFAGKDTKNISSSAFSVGGIDANGEYVETKDSIFTKEMFLCQGLTVEPDFTLDSTYSIYFYNYDGLFLESFEDLTDKFVNRVPELAKYARISIDSADGEDLKWYEIASVAKRLKITVDKKQDFTLTNWFSLDKAHEGTQVTYNPDGAQNGNLYVQYVANMHNGVSNASMTPTTPIDVSKWESLAIIYEEGKYSTSELVYFFAKPMYGTDGKRVESTDGVAQWEIVPADTKNVRFTGNLQQIVIEVPDGATMFFSNSFTDADYHYQIVQYK